MGILSAIIRDNKFEPEDVPKFEAKLFFEGAKRRQYWERFGVLLFLAAVIATMGVIGDSTATVIAIAILIVTVPLAITGARIATHAIEQQQTKALTTAWVGGTSFNIQDLKIDFLTEKINISISGSGEPPPLAELGPQLEKVFRQPVEIKLNIIPANEKQYPVPVSENNSED
jgi:hypothetical protein